MTPPTVAVIHAGTSSVTVSDSVFDREFPLARRWNLIDDLLMTEADAAGGLTPELHGRMSRLVRYAIDGGADAVQLACSMYGPVAAVAGYAVPVFASDHAAFVEISRQGYRRLGIVGSLGSAVADTRARLAQFLSGDGPGIAISTVALPPGWSFGRSDLGEVLNELGPVDAVLIAQYSLTEVGETLAGLSAVPVLNPAALAARGVRSALGGAR
jgi:hypothetical protein